MLRTTLYVLLALFLLNLPVTAQEQDEAIELFAAYQSGYMQVVAVSCFQLYSSSGVVTTDYLNGYIDGPTAQAAMTHNRLLLSTCITTLEQVRVKTPAEDTIAHDEINRLRALLGGLDKYFSAADNFFTGPTEETADAADLAQSALDRAMEEYAGPPAE